MTSIFPDNHEFENHQPAELYESSRQVQILTIVLTTINILAAVAMAGRILWDTRGACMERQKWLRKDDFAVLEEKSGEQKEGDGGGGGGLGGGLGLELGQGISTGESTKMLIDGHGEEPNTRAWWEMIPATDLFPLILAITIFIQGIMLAVVEGKGLNRGPEFAKGNCRYTSEIAWVALWITPYIVLSFTIEATIRALSQPRFNPRSRRAVLYCILFALILTLLTWIPSRTMPESTEQDICNGQLMSFVDQFAAGGLGLMSALLPIAIFMGVVVIMHLTIAKDEIEEEEKVASSRTVCFLIINILQWILMVPNYALTAQDHPQRSTSELATVVANIGGIAACGLHFYLRANTGPGDANCEGPSIIHPGHGPDKPTEGEKTDNKRDQNEDTMDDDQAVLSSIIIEYSDPEEISRVPETNDRPSPETPTLLLTPRSPTSIYSKGHRSSRAPSLFSQYTAHSFKRLGDEITNMITGLRAADNLASSKRLPPTPPTPRKPASNYTLFPPSADRPRTPHAPISKPQVPIPTCTLSRPPTRPSRAATPTINMDRRQPNPKLLAPTQLVKSDRPAHKLQIPKPTSKPNTKGIPAKSFEVAIPPRVDSGDAESFMEILIWKKDNPTESGRV